jgi:hypothetical protein
MKREDRDVDFYEQNGMLVMSKDYHLRRGYCCKSGCLNCPYGYLKDTDEQDNLTTDNE